MKKTKKWLLLAAAAIFVLIVGQHLFHLGGWGARNIAVWRGGGSQFQGFNNGGFFQSGFHRGGFGGMRGGGRFVRTTGIFGSFFVSLIFIIIGWFLRKAANTKIWKKWLGWMLMIIGALSIIGRAVPVILLLLIIGAGIYWLTKKDRSEMKVDNFTGDSSIPAVPTVTSKVDSILDEWEKKVMKEEK